MLDAGDAHFCVGIAISSDCHAHTVSLSQTALIDCIVVWFRLTDAYPAHFDGPWPASITAHITCDC